MRRSENEDTSVESSVLVPQSETDNKGSSRNNEYLTQFPPPSESILFDRLAPTPKSQNDVVSPLSPYEILDNQLTQRFFLSEAYSGDLVSAPKESSRHQQAPEPEIQTEMKKKSNSRRVLFPSDDPHATASNVSFTAPISDAYSSNRKRVALQTTLKQSARKGISKSPSNTGKGRVQASESFLITPSGPTHAKRLHSPDFPPPIPQTESMGYPKIRRW